ncbi:hypothetical protein L9F63_002088, partial [Diploptera punctata]
DIARNRNIRCSELLDCTVERHNIACTLKMFCLLFNGPFNPYEEKRLNSILLSGLLYGMNERKKYNLKKDVNALKKIYRLQRIRICTKHSTVHRSH